MNAINIRLLSAFYGVMLLAQVPGAGASTISYTYDAAGRIVAAGYGTGKSISYAYDNAGNQLLSSQPAPGLLISRPSANQLNLYWPSVPGSLSLYYSSSLGTGAQWHISLAIPTPLGNLNVVTQALSPFTTFYRLQP